MGSVTVGDVVVTPTLDRMFREHQRTRERRSKRSMTTACRSI
jgi:hypothetical protein